LVGGRNTALLFVLDKGEVVAGGWERSQEKHKKGRPLKKKTRKSDKAKEERITGHSSRPRQKRNRIKKPRLLRKLSSVKARPIGGKRGNKEKKEAHQIRKGASKSSRKKKQSSYWKNKILLGGVGELHLGETGKDRKGVPLDD